MSRVAANEEAAEQTQGGAQEGREGSGESEAGESKKIEGEGAVEIIEPRNGKRGDEKREESIDENALSRRGASEENTNGTAAEIECLTRP